MSERRACAILGADRSSVRYRGIRPDDAALRARLQELADQRRRLGYRRLHVLLRLRGHALSRKKTRAGSPAREGWRCGGASLAAGSRWRTRRSAHPRGRTAAGRLISCMTSSPTADASGCSTSSTTSRRNASRQSPTLPCREKCGPRAREADRPARRGRRYRQRQRDRIHVFGRAEVHPGAQSRLALHRAKHADANGVHRLVGRAPGCPAGRRRRSGRAPSRTNAERVRT